MSSRSNHTKNHTVILKPRGVYAPSCQKNGSVSSYSNIALHSKPKPPPNIPQKLYLASSRDSPQRRVSSEIFSHDRSPASSLLVRFGIDSYLGRMVTQILILLILFQPVYVAMGMELEDTPSTPLSQTTEDVGNDSSEVVDDSGAEIADSIVPEADVYDAEEDSTPETEEVVTNGEEVTQTSNDDIDAVSETGEGVTDSPEEDAVVDVHDTEENVTVTDEETPPSDDGFEDEGATENEVTGDVGANTAGTDENDVVTDVDDESLEDSATTTDEVFDGEVPVVHNMENKYVFGEGDCTLVSDGEFYCVAAGPERQVSSEDPRVYAEKDREGDKEIFYFDGIEIHRITNNSYDDFAPVFDDETLRIVWQAMLNDRLQIMIHEIPTKTTRQVTKNRQNSTNPSIAGDTIVWQEWMDTNWEIMMTDIDDIGQEFDIEQLTDNVVHDMFPAAYDGLITWQSERGSSWEVVVYDMRTEKKHTLEKNEGTKYENPRRALLFDSKHDNGDVETIGYDLDTGEMTELGTKANPQPFVPKTPRDEVPEAIPQGTNSISTSTKEDTDSDADPVIE